MYESICKNGKFLILLLNTIFRFKISACGNPSVTNKRKPAVINFTQEITKVKNLWS